jgi:hydroxyacylglutathione hydrolase
MTQTEHLPPQRVWELVSQGEAVLVDLRPPSAFAQAHPKNALSIPFSMRGVAERLSLLIPAGTRVVLLGQEDIPAEQVWAQLDGSPFPPLGIVQGGIRAWQEAGLPVESLPEISIHELVQADDLVVVDVREPMEWEMGHVPNALLISLGELRHNLDRIPRDRTLAIICESGVRSCTAASLLRREGFAAVANVPEGTRGYRNTPDLPLMYWVGETHR